MSGKLDCLEHLIAKGANLEVTSNVSAAPPAAPSPLRLSFALRPRRPPAPAAPPSPPPLTACGAAAAPPQDGDTALICAAIRGELDCLEHLVAKGAKLNVRRDKVRRGPPCCGVAARGVGG